MIPAFCRNHPRLSLLVDGASRVRCAGLTPALDPPSSPTRNSKEALLFDCQHFRKRIVKSFKAVRTPGSLDGKNKRGSPHSVQSLPNEHPDSPLAPRME